MRLSFNIDSRALNGLIKNIHFENSGSKESFRESSLSPPIEGEPVRQCGKLCYATISSWCKQIESGICGQIYEQSLSFQRDNQPYTLEQFSIFKGPKVVYPRWLHPLSAHLVKLQAHGFLIGQAHEFISQIFLFSQAKKLCSSDITWCTIQHKLDVL